MLRPFKKSPLPLLHKLLAHLPYKYNLILNSGDSTSSNAASNVAGGLNQAKGAIAEIAGQILTRQVPSAKAHNQTLDGLTAKNALTGITLSMYRSHSGVMDAVSAVASKVDDTIAAGGQVMASC
ncbi:hypothetical protein C0995_000969 [Termitomyces sp. Mi166|nr:hypothetical protein C0995_000969 [Termitomyces sp. Mi166\